MAAEVEAWHRRRRDVRLHCFWDRDHHQPHPNLTFHPLCGERFLRLMARSRGVVCTAGFESISEALWLGKPAYMVPTPGHLEQRTNALDAARTEAGMCSQRFDLDGFIGHLDEQPPEARAATQRQFRAWVRRGEDRFVEAIEAAVEERPALVRVGVRGSAPEAA
jgi:UDP-N-acetylglucosamine:LPS N-acetylglucosamine transferase